LDIPNVTRKRPYRDFLIAINPRTPSFSNYWQNRLISQETIPDFYSLIQQYREFQASVSNQKLPASHRAFGPTLNSRTPEGKRSPCLCGNNHRFSKCPYLIPQERPQGWKANSTIEQKVQEALYSKKLRDLVEDLRRYTIEYEKKEPELVPIRPNNL
jgi:hypothetical protein